MKCFYHSADLDGHCSGAIVKFKVQDCELYGVNYGSDSHVEGLVEDGETIYMVDYGLQPFSRMVELNKRCNLIWIDHHKTAIDNMVEAGIKINGVQIEGLGACALVWDWFYPKEVMPYGVKLLAEYDVWNHSDPKTLPFQWGIRQYDTLPNGGLNIWDLVLRHDNDHLTRTIEEGQLILNYEDSQNAKFCKAYAFYTEFAGHSAICCNRGFTNSKLFDSIGPETYDIMITFCRTTNQIWTVSMYSTKVDVGAIAKSYGGGGHKGAAGFQCEIIPFEI